MANSTLTAEGFIAIPREFRRRLDLKAGDQLSFEMDTQGNLVLHPEGKSKGKESPKESAEDEQRQQILSLGGSWNDLAEEQWEELAETLERGKQFFESKTVLW